MSVLEIVVILGLFWPLAAILAVSAWAAYGVLRPVRPYRLWRCTVCSAAYDFDRHRPHIVEHLTHHHPDVLPRIDA